MALTYEPIATQTLGSATATVTFSSITGTYTDLILVTNGHAGADYYTLRVNSDSGTNYSRTIFYNNAGTAASVRQSNLTEIYGSIGTSSTNIGGTIHHFFNYANTTTNKSILRRGGSDNTSSPQAEIGLWRSTSAINAISMTAGSGNFAIGTTFSLYGVKAA